MCLLTFTLLARSDLFNWIWPGIVQRALDEFRDSWNKHQIWRQPQKEMPSGSSPMNFFIMPGEYGGRSGAVSLESATKVISELREEIEVTKEEAFRWVDDDFALLAEETHLKLGSPPIELGTAWSVFVKMEQELTGV